MAIASSISRTARKAISLVLYPFELMASVLLLLTGFRFLHLTAPGRIGHLASEPDTFIKEQMLELAGRRRGILLSPPGFAANERLLDYWGRYIRIVRSPIAVRLLRRFYRFSYLQHDVSKQVVAINETAHYLSVQRAWGNRPALLQLDERHGREGRARLAAAGVPADAEIVCFHTREAGYSPADDALHAFRNCKVENYLPAVSELTKRGFWCIRMGDPSASRLAPQDKVIDYAHLEIRSDAMDVFLCASCRFFLGSSSGLIFLANVFGRPSGSANHAPLSTVLAFGRNDVAIPKLLWSEREGRYLSFAEVFGSDIGNFRFSELYEARAIRNVENTPEDIRDLALEMLERSEGRAVYTAEDEAMQERFRALMRPGHFSYGGVTRVGREFLRKYASLLGDQAG